jgi:hypothetical protein
MLEIKKLPTLDQDGFVLISGVDSHREFPTTFLIPSDDDKAQVGEGCYVKLQFNIRTVDTSGKEEMNGERMWVIVEERDGDWFTGILDNQSIITAEMKPGLVLHFNAEHILAIGESLRDALKKATEDQS